MINITITIDNETEPTKLRANLKALFEESKLYQTNETEQDSPFKIDFQSYEASLAQITKEANIKFGGAKNE